MHLRLNTTQEMEDRSHHPVSLEVHLQEECEADDLYRHYQVIQKQGFDYLFCPVLFGVCVVNYEFFLISIYPNVLVG